MAGPGETLRSPWPVWPPLAIRPRVKIWWNPINADERLFACHPLKIGNVSWGPTKGPPTHSMLYGQPTPRRPFKIWTLVGRIQTFNLLSTPNGKSHRRMARGGHGLPKVSPCPDMPYPSMPFRRDAPETALHPFQVWAPHRVGSLRLSSTPLDTPYHTHMERVKRQKKWHGKFLTYRHKSFNFKIRMQPNMEVFSEKRVQLKTQSYRAAILWVANPGRPKSRTEKGSS
jgi:hypothetical protein